MADTAVTATDWVWGITLSVLASIIGGASKLSIRKSWIIHGELHEGCSSVVLPDVSVAKRESTELSTTGSPRICKISTAKALYFCGMIGMSFLNPICCVLAMQYANPSILAPFSGLSLVWVILFSDMVVGEHPQRSQKVACALIVFGEVLVALFGDHTNANNMDIDDVIESYVDPPFIVLMISMFSFISMLHFIIKRFPKTSLLKKMAWGSVGGAISKSLIVLLVSRFAQILTILFAPAGFQNYLKDSLTIFKAARTDGDQLPRMFYLLFILAMTTGFAGLFCLSACMKRYDATYASAMFVVSFVITASIMSAVHYHTFSDIGGERAIIMYLLGLGILIYGASILVRPQNAACIYVEKEAAPDSDHSQVSDNSKEESLLDTSLNRCV